MGNDVWMDLWGVGEIESDKKPSQRGEHDGGGSLAGNGTQIHVYRPSFS